MLGSPSVSFPLNFVTVYFLTGFLSQFSEKGGHPFVVGFLSSIFGFHDHFFWNLLVQETHPGPISQNCDENLV